MIKIFITFCVLIILRLLFLLLMKISHDKADKQLEMELGFIVPDTKKKTACKEKLVKAGKVITTIFRKTGCILKKCWLFLHTVTVKYLPALSAFERKQKRICAKSKFFQTIKRYLEKFRTILDSRITEYFHAKNKSPKPKSDINETTRTIAIDRFEKTEKRIDTVYGTLCNIDEILLWICFVIILIYLFFFSGPTIE